MARRATVIQEQREANQYVLLVDAGNALFSTQDRLTLETKGRAIIEAYNFLGYDAMGLGQDDVQLGAEVLKARIAEAQFPIVSANVYVGNSQDLLTRPYVILERGGHRIAILGLTWGEMFIPESLQQPTASGPEPQPVPQPTVQTSGPVPPSFVNGLRVEDPVVAASKYLAEIVPQADIIVVLSTMGSQYNQRLPAFFPMVDLVVSGGDARRPAPPAPVLLPSNTVVAEAGYDGMWIGRVTMDFDSTGTMIRQDGEAYYLTDPPYSDEPAMREFLTKQVFASTPTPSP
ncbi:MAG: bifunctional metallophosphatase/5'-nucleotidase [Chloroflexi bacterium]|nr:bifunctional metallophosphatase/5'-nucleotidase [Chloroflexota bacterium]